MAPDAGSRDNPFSPPVRGSVGVTRPAEGVSRLGTVTRYAVLGTLLGQVALLAVSLGALIEPSDETALGLALLAVGGLAALAFLAAFLTAAIAWSIWSYRIAAALRAGGAPLPHTPGWVVGWWFVPFANLFMPFRVTRDLFVAAAVEEDGVRAPGWLTAWWIAWVASNVLGNLSFRVMGTPAEVPVDLLAGIAGVASSALAVQVVHGLTARFVAWDAARPPA